MLRVGLPGFAAFYFYIYLVHKAFSGASMNLLRRFEILHL